MTDQVTEAPDGADAPPVVAVRADHVNTVNGRLAAVKLSWKPGYKRVARNSWLFPLIAGCTGLPIKGVPIAGSARCCCGRLVLLH